MFVRSNLPNLAPIPCILLSVLYLVACPTGPVPSEKKTSHFDSGLQSYEQGHFHEAISEFDWELAQGTEDAAVYHARADALYEIGKYYESLHEYSKAIELNPDDASAYGYRGWCHRKVGDLRHALDDWAECSRRLNISIQETRGGPAVSDGNR